MSEAQPSVSAGEGFERNEAGETAPGLVGGVEVIDPNEQPTTPVADAPANPVTGADGSESLTPGTEPASFGQGADTDGTFDVDGADPVAMPVGFYNQKGRAAAIQVVDGLLASKFLKADGDPGRTAKYKAKWLKQFIAAVAEALERI